MLKVRKTSKWLALALCMLLVMAPVAMASSQQAGIEKIQDNELVINSLNDKGEIQDIKVLSHLRVFGSGSQTIEDTSSFALSSVRNLYGNEKIAQKDGKLMVPVTIEGGSGFADLYYLSTLQKDEVSKVKHPVSVKVTYFLDGQPIEASKLAGKNGHLKIVCELENLTGTQKDIEFTNNKGEKIKSKVTVYTPYVVSLSGWELDNKKFSHVTAPGIAGESPEGVVVDIQGKTTVSWTAPLIPPKFAAKQYAVLEADGRDIELPAFKIAIIPIVPTTAEGDSLSSVQDSLLKLYGAFDAIEGGVGAPNKDATLLFGLSSLKDGMGQVSGGIGSLVDKVKQVRYGLSNPAFDANTLNAATGKDANGNGPGVREAVNIAKTGMDTKLVPAMEAQKKVLDAMQVVVGTPSDQLVEPSMATSIYNDVNYMRKLLSGTPAEAVINQAINPKLMGMYANIGVLRDGGTLISAAGSIPFPASVTAVEGGVQQISGVLGKADAGLGMIVLGLGQVGPDGQPAKVMVDGKPGSILYALSYMQTNIDGKMIPGIVQLEAGTSKIGAGSGQAKDGISAGLDTMASVPAIVSALEENASGEDTFLGKPQGAIGTVTYVYQTPEVSKQAKAMNVGLGVIALALILLFAVGRPPKQVGAVQSESA